MEPKDKAEEVKVKAEEAADNFDYVDFEPEYEQVRYLDVNSQYKEITRENYFEFPALSASLINRYDYLVELNNRHRLEDSVRKDSYALFLGTQVHKALETNGESLKNIFYFSGGENLPALSYKVKEFFDSDMTFDSYINIYNNADTRKAALTPLKRKQSKAYQSYLELCEQLKPHMVLKNKINSITSDNSVVVVDNIEYLTTKEKEECIERITKAYAAAATDLDYNSFVDAGAILKDDVEILHEKPFVIEYLGYALKILCDKLIINHTTKTIDYVDFKTTTKGYKNFIKYGSINQMSIYKQVLLTVYPKYTVNIHVLFIDTLTFETKFYTVSPHSLLKAMVGGYRKTILHDKVDAEGYLNLFMNEDQLSAMLDLGFTVNTPKSSLYHRGWSNLIEDMKKYKMCLDKIYSPCLVIEKKQNPVSVS